MTLNAPPYIEEITTQKSSNSLETIILQLERQLENLRNGGGR